MKKNKTIVAVGMMITLLTAFALVSFAEGPKVLHRNRVRRWEDAPAAYEQNFTDGAACWENGICEEEPCWTDGTCRPGHECDDDVYENDGHCRNAGGCRRWENRGHHGRRGWGCRNGAHC